MHRLDDRVLGKETGKRRYPTKCQRPDQRRPVGHGHVLAQAPHRAHVLLVVQSDDDRTGSEKQQCLEEGMRREVKYPCSIGRHGIGDHHVTELGNGRVGHDTLDVILHDRHETKEKRR